MESRLAISGIDIRLLMSLGPSPFRALVLPHAPVKLPPFVDGKHNGGIAGPRPRHGRHLRHIDWPWIGAHPTNSLPRRRTKSLKGAPCRISTSTRPSPSCLSSLRRRSNSAFRVRSDRQRSNGFGSDPKLISRTVWVARSRQGLPSQTGI